MDKRILIAQKALGWIHLLDTPKEVIVLIGELLNYLPDSRKWKDDETWKWCWEELSDEAQSEVVLVRQKAARLLQMVKEAEEVNEH